MGTAGEPAIDFIVNAKTDAGLPKVNIVDFDGTPWDPSDQALARTIVSPISRQMSVVFNPKYQAENPFAFTSIHAHEALHSDTQITGTEEIINLALQSYIYLEQLTQHPDLALADTELTRRNNTNALTRLNSGEDDELGLFSSHNHESILPGSPLFVTSWFGQFANNTDFGDTPGNPVLRAYLANIAEKGSVVPSSPNFDMATLQFLDQNSARLAQQLETKQGLRLFDALELANVDQGDAGPNHLTGTAIMDHLSGLAGDDDLRGFADDDRLDGGTGKDRIAGRRGNDDLYGGPDADTFVFAKRGGHDVIHDFNPGEGDRLQIAKGLLRGHIDVTEHAGNTELAFGDGTTVMLLGVSRADLVRSVALGHSELDCGDHSSGWDWLA